MTFSWTPHRFSGGALVLDVANSVVLRHDPAESIDRFAVDTQLAAFPAAAENFCAERALFGTLAPVAAASRHHFIRLREAVDRYFRQRILGGDDGALLADLLEAITVTLRHGPGNGQEHRLDIETAHSALRLIAMPEPDRMKICGNCGWLFLDRSKNKSRAWCDMAVCGNRAKASRYYRRRKGEDMA